MVEGWLEQRNIVRFLHNVRDESSIDMQQYFYNMLIIEQQSENFTIFGKIHL